MICWTRWGCRRQGVLLLQSRLRATSQPWLPLLRLRRDRPIPPGVALVSRIRRANQPAVEGCFRSPRARFRLCSSICLRITWARLQELQRLLPVSPRRSRGIASAFSNACSMGTSPLPQPPLPRIIRGLCRMKHNQLILSPSLPFSTYPLSVWKASCILIQVLLLIRNGVQLTAMRPLCSAPWRSYPFTSVLGLSSSLMLYFPPFRPTLPPNSESNNPDALHPLFLIWFAPKCNLIYSMLTALKSSSSGMTVAVYFSPM